MGSHQLASLIRMANQIAENNRHVGDDAAVAKVVSGHLSRFWARSMKQQIQAYLQAGGEELNPAARVAIAQL
ncbi:formate dehydrogenase subunit delta [Pontibacterium sp.]|jgi:formate dehydrogenase subunit delta|uniref:formate dehydrogenase subunit delta n=1 Tax=Pontibacterium sp. TaxID=2036026 RepID=UPI003566D3BB|nr:formate dehydrogenase subunit delta [Oceanospirillaceae bacterium]